MAIQTLEVPAENERDLVLQCQAGDRQAFNRLVMRYQNLIYTFLRRMAPKWNDIDDLAQEVFVKMFHSIRSLNDAAQFKSWLYRIAVTVYLDEYRRWKKRQSRFVSDEEALRTHVAEHGNPKQAVEQKELQQSIQEALNKLPEEYRMAVVLREIHELSYEEIAQTLHISEGTVRSRIFRGRKLLQDLLQKEVRQKGGWV